MGSGSSVRALVPAERGQPRDSAGENGLYFHALADLWCILSYMASTLQALQALADDLEKQLTEGRPRRCDARALHLGRRYMRSSTGFDLSVIAGARRRAIEDGEPDADLLAHSRLELHGWRIDGALIHPPAEPLKPGAVPDPAPDSASDSAGAAGAVPGGVKAISRTDAARVVTETRTWLDWAAAERRRDIVDHDQERRALLIGRHLMASVLQSAQALKSQRKAVKETEDELAVELWSDAELRRDYPDLTIARR